jgi:tetratricopeptide (TPR) repeat protein
VTVDILRPGSYAALSAHLAAVQDNQGAGYYHVIHFDVHGKLLTFAEFDALEQKLATSRYTFQPQRYGRPKLPHYAGVKAFLFLESGAPEVADPVEATELAKLLLSHQIPIAILNACQSGKQVGVSETSLGSQLMSAGMQMVLAMGYSVTVSAAETMMGRLYQQLFQRGDLAAAIRSARLELSNHKPRRAYFNQTIELEDWLLPVVYQNQPQQLTTRPFTDSEQKSYYERQATRYREPHITYGFVGRDLDILHIEQRLLRHQEGRDQNLLLVRGMGGAGKSTLLHHLAAWWQTTGLVDQVAYFGYDERAWSLQQILDALARQLLGEIDYLRQFQPLSLAAQQSFLATRLRATLPGQARHLLILDNLESITGSNLAILHTLPPAEQRALHGFLRELAGGKCLVLLGSRGPETWLAPGTFDANVYELPGLDAEAASTLADRILARHNATSYRNDPAMQQDLQRLITLLDGHPLALEVVLANLAKQTPGEVLAALQSGEVGVDSASSTEDKTKSILACINYSHSNLSPKAQQLLLCLAPFTGVINHHGLPLYTEHLKTQPALAHLPFHRWEEVLTEAINWGLLTPDGQLPIYLRVQPIFPYFLRTRWQNEVTLKAAVELSFQLYYTEIGETLAGWLASKEPRERQLGQVLTRFEYENLSTALDFALTSQSSILQLANALNSYLNLIQDHQRFASLGELILSKLETYPPDKLSGQSGLEFCAVLGEIGNRQLSLKQYPEAKASYEKARAILEQNKMFNESQKKGASAGFYHGLGMVAQAQRQWAQAEQYYQQTLALQIEFNNRYRQADTYHNLGVVAQGQRQWVQAEQHYQQALALKIEFNNRYAQADTYHNLGVVAQGQRQWAQAEQHYQHALAIYIEFNDRYAQADTYHNLGVVAQEQRQWAQAEQHYQHALAIYIEFNDRYAQARTYHQLGIVAQGQRQWAQAEQHYQQALALKIEFNDRYAQADTYHQLGIVAQEQRQWAQAEQHYQQALAIYIEFNDRYTQARTYHQSGRVSEEQEQWQQAYEYFVRALAIYVEFADEHNFGIVQHSLRRLWLAHPAENVLPTLAQALGMTVEAALAWITTTDMGSNGCLCGATGMVQDKHLFPPASAVVLCGQLRQITTTDGGSSG